MMFRMRDLSVLAYANGFTIWHYRGGMLETICSAGFFNEAAEMLHDGDMILAVGADGGTVRIVTASKYGEPVTTAPLS